MVGLLVYQCWKAKRVLFRPYCDGPLELFQAAAFWFRRSRQLRARKAGADSPKKLRRRARNAVSRRRLLLGP
jgi:hypothetical protein